MDCVVGAGDSPGTATKVLWLPCRPSRMRWRRRRPTWLKSWVAAV